MKRYISGIVAVIIAIAAVAFTMPTQTQDMYVFEYQGDYSQGSVSELENWHFEGINAPQCNNGIQKACRLAVSADNVDNPYNPTSLADEVVITEGGSGTNRIVTHVSGLGSTYSNRSN